MRDCAERTLVDDYLARARRLAAQLGHRTLEEIEVDAGGGPEREALRAAERLKPGVLVCLDERGEPWSSKDLADRLARWRDAGDDACFVVGGADGLAPDLLGRARHRLAFGRQTWPHRLVRVMLAEQLYRALSIEAGAPYHRE